MACSRQHFCFSSLFVCVLLDFSVLSVFLLFLFARSWFSAFLFSLCLSYVFLLFVSLSLYWFLSLWLSAFVALVLPWVLTAFSFYILFVYSFLFSLPHACLSLAFYKARESEVVNNLFLTGLLIDWKRDHGQETWSEFGAISSYKWSRRQSCSCRIVNRSWKRDRWQETWFDFDVIFPCWIGLQDDEMMKNDTVFTQNKYFIFDLWTSDIKQLDPWFH